MKARLVIAVAAGLLIPSLAHAAEIKLLASTAIKDAYLELIPPFEKATGHKVTVAWSSTPDIQKRIAGDSNCARSIRKTFEIYFDARGNDGPLSEVINLAQLASLPPADYSVDAPAKTGE